MDMNNDAWLYGKRQPLVVAVGVLTIKVHFEQDWGETWRIVRGKFTYGIHEHCFKIEAVVVKRVELFFTFKNSRTNTTRTHSVRFCCSSMIVFRDKCFHLVKLCIKSSNIFHALWVFTVKINTEKNIYWKRNK